MAFQQMIINHESPPTRCEICHLTDEFDANSGICRRCATVAIPVQPVQNVEKPLPVAAINQLPYEKEVLLAIKNFFIGIGISILGAILSMILGAVPLFMLFSLIGMACGLGFVLITVGYTCYMVCWTVVALFRKIYDNLLNS